MLLKLPVPSEYAYVFEEYIQRILNILLRYLCSSSPFWPTLIRHISFDPVYPVLVVTTS